MGVSGTYQVLIKNVINKMDTQPKDISKIVNNIVVVTLLISIIAIIAVYLIFGSFLKAPEEITNPAPVPELSVEEKQMILDNLEDSENPVSDKAALDTLKNLRDTKTPQMSAQEKENILNSL